MDIVLASHNRHKITEMEQLLHSVFPSVRLLSLDDIGFAQEIAEDGQTFEDNALIKARAVTRLGYIGIADDSGLAVDALGGAPGVYSARYAGEPCDDRKNNLKLLDKLADVAEQKRSARFVSVIAIAFPDAPQRDFTVRGECEGRILTAFAGDGGFGYAPLFYVPQMHKTFAQMSFDEKNQVSHRARAMAAFAEKSRQNAWMRELWK